MAGWRLKRGMPEWHEVMLFRDELRDGTIIEAYTEDCDGDFYNWGVKENGVVVAEGTCCDYEDARASAERVINFGPPLPATQVAGAAKEG